MGRVTHIKLTPEMKTAFDSPGVAARSVPIQPADGAPRELGAPPTPSPQLGTEAGLDKPEEGA